MSRDILPSKSTRTWLAAALLTAIASSATQAGEFGAQAEVLRREAVYRTVTSAPRCRYPQAPLDDSLGARLRWDLGQAREQCEGAANRRELEGYRVTWRWNGRQHTDFMPYDPGDTLPVKVHVD